MNSSPLIKNLEGITSLINDSIQRIIGKDGLTEVSPILPNNKHLILSYLTNNLSQERCVNLLSWFNYEIYHEKQKRTLFKKDNHSRRSDFSAVKNQAQAECAIIKIKYAQIHERIIAIQYEIKKFEKENKGMTNQINKTNPEKVRAIVEQIENEIEMQIEQYQQDINEMIQENQQLENDIQTLESQISGCESSVKRLSRIPPPLSIPPAVPLHSSHTINQNFPKESKNHQNNNKKSSEVSNSIKHKLYYSSKIPSIPTKQTSGKKMVTASIQTSEEYFINPLFYDSPKSPHQSHFLHQPILQNDIHEKLQKIHQKNFSSQQEFSNLFTKSSPDTSESSKATPLSSNMHHSEVPTSPLQSNVNNTGIYNVPEYLVSQNNIEGSYHRSMPNTDRSGPYRPPILPAHMTFNFNRGQSVKMQKINEISPTISITSLHELFKDVDNGKMRFEQREPKISPRRKRSLKPYLPSYRKPFVPSPRKIFKNKIEDDPSSDISKISNISSPSSKERQRNMVMESAMEIIDLIKDYRTIINDTEEVSVSSESSSSV